MRATLFLLSGLSLFMPAFAEDAPPSIEYPPSRSSTANVDTGGVLVAVDKGIEWKGVKVYLSLTFDLVAVDTATQKTIWHQGVSAFWNKLSFKEVEAKNGQKVWAVELRTSKGDDAQQKLAEYRDLKTGAKIETPEQQPSGKSLMPVSRMETACAEPRPFVVLASTADNFKTVWSRLNGAQKATPEVDFQKSVVVVYCLGDCINTSDLLAKEAYEDANRILLRCEISAYQTIGKGDKSRVCAIFQLPRREGLEYIVERNSQSYIAGPPIWKTVLKTKLGDPAHELDKLPAVAKAR